MMNNKKVPCWVWNKLIDDKVINHINHVIRNSELEPEIRESGGLYPDGSEKKNCTANWVQLGYVPDLQNIINAAFMINQEIFGYNLYPITPYKKGLYQDYDESNEAKYDWHSDESSSQISDTKLSFIINLSENTYKGGDFLLGYPEEECLEMFNNPGSAILFKSHILHKVTPVIKGNRKTLTIFLEGPKFT